MNLKNKTKFLLVLGIIFVAFLLFNTNKVQAYGDTWNNNAINGIVEKGTPTESSLKNIPDTITLDMKTTEIDEIPDMIFNQVVTELNNQGITIKTDEIYSNENTIDLWVELNVPYELKNPYCIEKVSVVLYGSDVIAEKDIIINWTNISTYNETDKKYVENQLSKLPKSNHKYTDGIIEKNSYIGEQEYELGTDGVIDIPKHFKELTGLTFINTGMGTGGGLMPFNDSNESMFAVFKDGICYAIVNVLGTPPTKITIPNNIEDTESAYIDYAIPKIEEYLKTYDDGVYSGKVTLEKISAYWYKVTSDGENCGEIIIKKDNGAYIGNNIYADNLAQGVNINVTEKENTTMETELKNKGYTNILGSYELELTGADTLVNPIDITFNVGTEYNGKTIYILHQKKDGTYENFEKKIDDGKVTITVSELSPFVLGVKETNTETENKPTQPEEPTQPTQPTKPTNKGEKDETPKTGTIDIIGYVLVATMLSGVGIVALKKNLK